MRPTNCQQASGCQRGVFPAHAGSVCGPAVPAPLEVHAKSNLRHVTAHMQLNRNSLLSLVSHTRLHRSRHLILYCVLQCSRVPLFCRTSGLPEPAGERLTASHLCMSPGRPSPPALANQACLYLSETPRHACLDLQRLLPGQPWAYTVLFVGATLCL